jgi:acid stress-induced BolA-like protein IbaG/YrbA
MGKLKRKSVSRPQARRKLSRRARPRGEIKRMLEQALRKEFPCDTVDVSDGYMDNIHVVVVSRKFDGMDHTVKWDYVWSLINKSDLSENEKTRVSLVMPLSPGELK